MDYLNTIVEAASSSEERRLMLEEIFPALFDKRKGLTIEQIMNTACMRHCKEVEAGIMQDFRIDLERTLADRRISKEALARTIEVREDYLFAVFNGSEPLTFCLLGLIQEALNVRLFLVALPPKKPAAIERKGWKGILDKILRIAC